MSVEDKDTATINSNTFDTTKLIADWGYWHRLKSKTLSTANNPKWYKKNIKKRVAQKSAQHNYLERWTKSKYSLLNKKNN